MAEHSIDTTLGSAIKEVIDSRFERLREELIEEAVEAYRDRLTGHLAKVSVELCEKICISQFGSELRITLDTEKLKLGKQGKDKVN